MESDGEGAERRRQEKSEYKPASSVVKTGKSETIECGFHKP